MFNLFKKEPQGNTHVLQTGEVKPAPAGWSLNKWVMVNNEKIGIVTKFYPTCEVHLVDDKGDTYLIIHTDIHTLRIARAVEIPEARRPSPEVAERLGYGA